MNSNLLPLMMEFEIRDILFFLKLFFRSINTHTGNYGRPTAAIMKAAHNVLHEEAHTNVCFISCDGHQLYDFKERGVDLEVGGVRYIEMHRGPAATYWARLLQVADISN